MISPIERLIRIGVTSESSIYSAYCDRLALNGSGFIQLVSIAAPTRIIQGFGASLAKGGPAANFSIDNTEFEGPEYERYEWETKGYVTARETRSYATLYRHPEGYTRYAVRIRYGWAHAVFVAKQPGLLLNSGDRAIGQALKDPAVCTTPFLPEWVPYIAGQLREQKLLNDLWCFQCRTAILKPGSSHEIDQIVLKGGQDGKITIPA